MKSLEELSGDDFKGHVDGKFAISGHEVTLKSVDIKPSAHKKFRDQICLLFESDADIGLESEMAVVAHPELGRHQLLVNRVADPENQDGPPLYEIVFG